ncbi:helix-turn-helix transcriptional regulator [Listeria sp. FSL L7-0253]|uniref:helix-turn-helix domain-containing protein n=1 Tax=Listeria cossartiae TaxID=2838249 RepID=UPI001626F432|nr:helix-turn-helix transcriptional regulator [Listeria cossartiae]MBC2187233.1 helix-turn-helix transcriptional regulator [Listeria cossartiae subsp. cossartiae]
MIKTLGETIKFIRSSKNISQKEICLDTISRSALVKIESDKTIPSAKTLEFILDQLSIDQEEFALVRNNFQLSTRQQLLEKFNTINTSIRVKKWLSLEQEMKQYLHTQTDPIINEYLAIVKALIIIETEDDYNKASLHVAPIWERISKNEVWFIDDIQLLTCIFYMFDNQVALTISQRLLKQTEKYLHMHNIKRIKANTLMNISTLYLNQEDYKNSLEFIDQTIHTAKKYEYYTLWLFAKGTKGILHCLEHKPDIGIPLIKESLYLLKALDQKDIAKALEHDVNNYVAIDMQG